MNFRQSQEPLVPRHIYKFTRSEFIDDLKRLGRIAINTTESYRKDDGKDGGLNDPEDAVREWRPSAGTYDVPFWMASRLKVPQGRDIKFVFEEGAVIRQTQTGAVFCCSHKMSPGIRTKMLREFGHDTYYRIDNVLEFVRVVSAHESLRDFRAHSDFVTYREYTEIERREGGPADPWTKRNSYAWQCEYRIAWQTPITWQPRLIDVPAILPYISFAR